MRVIYAIGEPRYLNFAVADRREAVPAGAILFAICTATRTMENLDEDLFDAITDEEYYTFRAMVSEAEQLEKQHHQSQPSTMRLSVKRFFNWLRGAKKAASSTLSGEHRMA